MTEPEPSQDALTRFAAASLDLDLPAECLPGVMANLAILAEHARHVAGDSSA